MASQLQFQGLPLSALWQTKKDHTSVFPLPFLPPSLPLVSHDGEGWQLSKKLTGNAVELVTGDITGGEKEEISSDIEEAKELTEW